MFVAEPADTVVQSADPQCAVAVFVNGADVCGRQSITGTVSPELAGTVAKQSIAACADPDAAIARDADRKNLSVRKAVGVVPHEPSVLESCDAVHRADPQLAGPVFRERRYSQ